MAIGVGANIRSSSFMAGLHGPPLTTSWRRGQVVERRARSAESSGLFAQGWPSLYIVGVGSVALTLVIVVNGAAILPVKHALRIGPTIALRGD